LCVVVAGLDLTIVIVQEGGGLSADPAGNLKHFLNGPDAG